MGTPVSWYKKHSFVIEIDGVARAAFVTCSDLKVEAANIAYREGGRLHPHNAPGLVTFPEITLTRGVCEDLDLYNWFKDCYDAAAGTGMEAPDLFRTFDIVQLNRKGEEVERYTVYGAYCRSYSAGAWDNNADEIRMEEVILQADYWERTPA